MRKIGGIKIMKTNLKFIRNDAGDFDEEERYCTVYESLEQSLKEMKLHREGKIKLRTWEEFYEELQQKRKQEEEQSTKES